MKKVLLLLALISSLITYSQTSAAAALITLDEIDASITKQIQSIDNLVTNGIGNGGNMLLSISSRLRKDINETIGNTDKVLRENQLALYNQLLSLTEEFNKTIKEDLDQIDLVATKITQTAGDFFFKKKEPNIFKYATQRYIKNYDNEYTLTVYGNSFDRSDDIFIEINNKQIRPVQSNFSKLIFKIDSTNIKHLDPNKNYTKGKITFKWRKGLFNIKKASTETFVIPIIPLKIGSVETFYEQELPEKKLYNKISYNCTCSTGASNWKGDKRKSSTAFNILPTSGRKIDPATVTTTDWRQRHGGGNHFQHKTEQQIKGSISCNSDGRPYGGGGFSSLTFSYQEFETIYKTHKKNTTKKEITSINPVLFELPDPVDGKRPNVNYVEVRTYDDKTFTLTPNSVNKYFALKINPVTDDITVEWKK